MEYHYLQSRTSGEMTEEEIYALAKNLLEHPKTLLEMPLVLIPEDLFQTSEEMRRHLPQVKSTLDTWIAGAKADDECLRIERRWIPFAETYISDTPEGRAFFDLANAFGQIPMAAGVVPKNQNQGYWLKTLHYFYQARGILFAYKLLGVILNPIGKDGLFTQCLSSNNIRNLEWITEADIAGYELIEQGKGYIQQWANKKGISYPFKHSLDLFLEIEKQAFLESWEVGPNSKELKWATVEEQQDFLAVRIRLLEQVAWIKGQDKRGTYQQQRQQYVEFLETYGWYGCFILALQPHQWELADPWKKYTDSLRWGKAAYIDDFYWQGGHPYRARELKINDNADETRKTRSRQRVEGTTDALGYLIWHWT